MELVVDGRRAYAYTGGKPYDPALPTVVFVHGALNDHSVWTLYARYCAHHGRSVLALDLPAHGRSEGPPLPDVGALAGWVLACLDAAGAPRAALIGHSMGGLIALEAASRAPERIERLGLFGVAYPMKVSDALLTTAERDPQAAIDMVNTYSHSSFAAKPSYPGPGSWLRGGSRALMRRVQAAQPGLNLFRHDFGVCDAYTGGAEAAARVRCPVGIVVGQRDQMTSPKQAATIAQALNATVHRVDAGHALMSEAPDAVLAALRRILD